MQEKVAILIDGWFMRKTIYRTKAFYYSGKEIHRYCQSLLTENQKLFRIYYYDTEPLEGRGHNPISKKAITFDKTNVAKDQIRILNEIRSWSNFALRLGVTNWKGKSWSLKTDTLKNFWRKKMMWMHWLIVMFFHKLNRRVWI